MLCFCRTCRSVLLLYFPQLKRGVAGVVGGNAQKTQKQCNLHDRTFLLLQELIECEVDERYQAVVDDVEEIHLDQAKKPAFLKEGEPELGCLGWLLDGKDDNLKWYEDEHGQ